MSELICGSCGSNQPIPYGYSLCLKCKEPFNFGNHGAAIINAYYDMREALRMIADIGEGSTTANSLPHIGRLARAALARK